MKIYGVKDVSSFFEKIQTCSGDVYFKDDSGELHDLKQLAECYTACKWPFQNISMNEIDVVASEPMDCIKLYRHMMEAR